MREQMFFMRCIACECCFRENKHRYPHVSPTFKRVQHKVMLNHLKLFQITVGQSDADTPPERILFHPRHIALRVHES